MASPKPTRSIIQSQLKLKLRPAQERMLVRWLWHLTGVYNWALKKIELDAKDGTLHPGRSLEALVRGHGQKIGVPTHTIQATVHQATVAWCRCFDGISGRPKLKGARNRLNSIPFPDPFASPAGLRIRIRGLGHVKFHDDVLPLGPIKSGRIVRRASGWYLCLFIEAEPNEIPHTGAAEIGIDPGFSSLLALSTGVDFRSPPGAGVVTRAPPDAPVGACDRDSHCRVHRRAVDDWSGRRT